ncbi:MAG: response regulator [Bacteroidetes bacterium]|nr:response regulator [Bacteroidota bacterium]
MNTIQTVCVIDDDTIFLYLIKKIIEKSGVSNATVLHENPINALESLKKIILEQGAFPEIILLDINMHHIDGWEFLDTLLPYVILAGTKTSIYIASSSIAAKDKLKAKTYPAIKGYLVKPIKSEKILEITNEFQLFNN